MCSEVGLLAVVKDRDKFRGKLFSEYCHFLDEKGVPSDWNLLTTSIDTILRKLAIVKTGRRWQERSLV